MSTTAAKALSRKKTMENGARLLDKWAEQIRDSAEIRYKGHPRYGKFDTDEYGKADEADYLELTKAARDLRTLAQLEAKMEPPKCRLCEKNHWPRDPHIFGKTKAADTEARPARQSAKPPAKQGKAVTPAADNAKPPRVKKRKKAKKKKAAK